MRTTILWLILPAVVGLSAPAWAGEVKVWRADGVVHGQMDVSLPPEQVGATVSDPWTIARIDGRGLVITKLSESRCRRLRYQVPSFIGEIDYVVDYCPGELSWTATLVESEDLEAYEARWRLEPIAGGTRIHYSILTVPRISVPQRLVESTTKRSVENMLEGLHEALVGTR